MECTAKILRERKVFSSKGEEEKILLYCPVIGEIVLSGEDAKKAREKLNIKKEVNES
jgi:hypothetical protein